MIVPIVLAIGTGVGLYKLFEWTITIRELKPVAPAPAPAPPEPAPKVVVLQRGGRKRSFVRR